jgi:hypothetical protein
MLTGGVGFDFQPERWELIKKASGVALNQAGRDRLSAICGDYVALRQAELEAPLASDALAQMDAIERAASALQAAIQALQSGEGAAPFVLRHFSCALREVHFEDVRGGVKPAPVFLDELPDGAERQALALVRAAGSGAT